MSAPHNPRAATFRSASGEILSTTWGGTWCWHPVNPAKYATTDDKGEAVHIIRCRECPGCLELNRRELADMLVATFVKEVSEIWVVLVEARVSDAGRLFLSVARIGKSWRAWGWCRIGANKLAIVVVGRKPSLRATRLFHGRAASLHRVRRTRGRRAWEMVTAGILYSRDVYGENVNRWYIRGLKRVAKPRRVGVWRGQARRETPEFRAGVAGVSARGVLTPPEAYRPPRLVKRAAAGAGRYARIKHVLEPIGVTLAGLPTMRNAPCNSGVRAVAGSPTPAGSASRSEMRVARPLFQENTIRSMAGRYSSSRVLDKAEIDGWVARMVEKSRARGEPDG